MVHEIILHHSIIVSFSYWYFPIDINDIHYMNIFSNVVTYFPHDMGGTIIHMYKNSTYIISKYIYMRTICYDLFGGIFSILRGFVLFIHPHSSGLFINNRTISWLPQCLWRNREPFFVKSAWTKPQCQVKRSASSCSCRRSHKYVSMTAKDCQQGYSILNIFKDEYICWKCEIFCFISIFKLCCSNIDFCY